MPISPQKLSLLIGGIYDCALDPELWPGVMDEICRQLDLRTGVISLIDMAAGQPLLAATTGFEAGWLERLPDFSEGLVSLWGGEHVVRNLPVEEPAVLSRVNPDAISTGSTDPFHLGFNRPQGFVDAIAVGLTRDETTIGTIGFNRHEDFGLIGPRELEIMRLLVPHLQRAVAVSRVLEMRRVTQQGFEDVLDGLDFPLAVVGPGLQLRFANAAAETLLARRGFLGRHGSALRFADGAVQRKLEAALGSLREGGQGSASPFGLAFRDERQTPWVLHLLPLNTTGDPGGRNVALFFSAPSGSSATGTIEALASLYDLTGAETRVLRLLCAGHPTRRIAAELGIADSTAKTHILRVYEKTGLHRQADLMSLTRFAVPVSER